MPWNESSKMFSRLEFVTLATAQGAKIRALFFLRNQSQKGLGGSVAQGRLVFSSASLI